MILSLQVGELYSDRDGAPAMVGRYRGFATLLKQLVVQVLTVHCMLHHHNLVAFLSPSLQHFLNIAGRAINKMKTRDLNDRIFRQSKYTGYPRATVWLSCESCSQVSKSFLPVPTQP